MFNFLDQINKICNNTYMSLGDRQKSYENILDINLPKNIPFIIRLDGKTFSKRVRNWGMKKPFDSRFNQCMIATCEGIFNNIQNIKAIWTGSDEISIIMDDTILDLLFNGRIEKIVSISSSIATSFFNLSAIKLNFKNIEEKPAWFDSRITIIPNHDEVINNILFRQHDCIRNSISTYARSFYSTKELIKKQREEQINMMKAKDFDWEEAKAWSKYGTLITKKYVKKEIGIDEEIEVKDRIEDFDEYDDKKFYIRTKLICQNLKFDFSNLKEIIYGNA